MLDGYIIDAIKQEERTRRQKDAEGRRVRLELPLPRGPRHGNAPEVSEEPDQPGADRGVIIIPNSPSVPLREDAA